MSHQKKPHIVSVWNQVDEEPVKPELKKSFEKLSSRELNDWRQRSCNQKETFESNWSNTSPCDRSHNSSQLKSFRNQHRNSQCISNRNSKINEQRGSQRSTHSDGNNFHSGKNSTENVFFGKDSDELLRKKIILDGKETSDIKGGPQRRKIMSFTRLRELTSKSPNEIVLTILNPGSGFSILLNETDIRRDVMAYILIALGRGCSCEMRENLSRMISTITSNSNLLISIQKYLVSFKRGIKSEKFHLDSLICLTEFLQKFQVSFPASSSDYLTILLLLLNRTCCDCLIAYPDLFKIVTERLKEIEEQNERFMKEYCPKEMEKASDKEKLQLQTPPENYRSIPVLPNLGDIHQPYTFLRPNVAKGRYHDTEHYLDVQYRLLREDYVKPLRDGIAEYLRMKKSGKSFKSCNDVRVYQDVHIIKQDFINGSLLHVAEFNAKNFANVKWEYSKRFLTGSLLCLSSDDFQTVLFASVARRVPEELKKGLLRLRFESVTNEVLKLNPLTSFVIIETDAYFEAYRYNLSALQELDDSLPLKRYIVDVECKIGKPAYLHATTAYDMRPLLLPLDKKYIKQMQRIDGVSIQYEFPLRITNVACSIPVLQDDLWPSFSDLNLDISQYEALKAAVTKEFAVIQGPPGTGKTYIGLRIVQLLLHNSVNWQPKEAHSPILIICYTNHALDQFLEGLMLFTHNIVRIGGRGTNEAVSQFQLVNLKKQYRLKKEFPKYLASNSWYKNSEVKQLQLTVNGIRKCVEKSLTALVSEIELRPYMSDTHYNSLKSIVHPSIDDGFVIWDWLNAPSGLEGININNCSENFIQEADDCKGEKVDDGKVKMNTSLESSGESEMEYEGETDVEFIEAQRDLDFEEYDDVITNVKSPENVHDVMFDEAGWQVQGGKQKQMQYIKHSLKRREALKKSEVDKIKNVWNLDGDLRWRLYKYWLQIYIAAKEVEVFETQQQLKNEFKELCEIRTEEDLFILQKADIIGMTTTGAAKYRNIVQRLNPRIVIVEEAAEILESHIVTSMASDTQHLILIGDHQQLQPSPTVHMLAVKYDLNVSLFERMVNNGIDCYTLTIQHRMRPNIAGLLVPNIYKNLQNHKSVTEYESIKGVSKDVFFITHNFSELHENDSKSKVNEHEAKFLIKFCKYLLLQGYNPSQITILTTYSGQLFFLKKLAAGNLVQDVRITVVDNFQGEENDIILVSFVRSNLEGQIGFLKISNRVCVALSRARKGLYCIGNFELLAANNKLWKDIVLALQQKQAIGPSLQLVCQNHPSVCNVVANEKDFDSVPEGGCTYNCEFRLACGHTCSLLCHTYNQNHELVRCQKNCNKLCNEGHECKMKCFQECGPCKKLVDKRFTLCGHVIKVHCYKKDMETKCTKPCEKFLNCGHQCTNKCGLICDVKCLQKIKIQSPVCGHKVSVTCFGSDSVEELSKCCNEPCRSKLTCGHMCTGTCKSCHQGRLHIACKQQCNRILVCSHKCTSPCSKSCPPCKENCENRCSHSKCPKKCGEPCEKCFEPCSWSCKHKRCTRFCGDLCDRGPCNEPCPKILICGHPCISFCGEPCPDKCKKCDAEIVRKIFFGEEIEDDAKFICLEDCNHLFEINGITEWMNTKKKGQIQMKACPKCKCVIRRNFRFGNLIKYSLADLEKVKKVIYGDKDRNLKIQADLSLKVREKRLVLDPICKPILNVLRSGRSRSIQEITTLENIINLAVELLSVTDGVYDRTYFHFHCDPLINKLTVQLTAYMRNSREWLVNFIQDEYLNASDQQLQDIMWEIHRLKLANKLFHLPEAYTLISPNPYFENCVQCLIKYSPFRDEELHKFSFSFCSLQQRLRGVTASESELEKPSALKAVCLSLGNWYKCTKGHVYCISDSGESMECHECNSGISIVY